MPLAYEAPIFRLPAETILPSIVAEPLLRITDGTVVIDLLSGSDGTFLSSVTPTATGVKGGGIWQDSPFSDGRQPVMSRWGNATETFSIMIKDEIDPDSIAERIRNIRDMLLRASQYWMSATSTDKIWLEARAKCETNIRYALLFAGTLPDENSHWSQPFIQKGSDRLFNDLVLSVERGHWQATPPNVSGEVMTIATSSPKATIHAQNLSFSGGSNTINETGGLVLRDLFIANAEHTFEGYFKFDAGTVPGLDRYMLAAAVISPFAMTMYVNPDEELVVTMFTYEASASCDFSSFLDNEWHHIAYTYDDTAGTRVPHIWLDGVEPTYIYQIEAQIASTWTTGSTVTIGNEGTTGQKPMQGSHAWFRISDTARYTANFTPTPLCAPPSTDVDTLGLYHMVTGQGVLEPNIDNPGTLDMTINSLLVWSECCVFTDGDVTQLGADNTITSGQTVQFNNYSNTRITHMRKVRVNASEEIISDQSSTNMLEQTLPYDIVEDWRVVGGEEEWTYVGVENNNGDSDEIQWGVPFGSLIFDLDTIAVFVDAIDAANPDKVLNVEYLSTSNTWVSVQGSSSADRTVSFSNLGKNAYLLSPPLALGSYGGGVPAIDNNGDPDPTNFLSGAMDTGVWMRFQVQYEYSATPRVQSHPYVQSWPHFNVIGSEISGEVGSLLQLRYTSLLRGDWNSAHIGIRSVSRGQNFTPVLHASENWARASGVFFLNAQSTQVDYPFANVTEEWELPAASYTENTDVVTNMESSLAIQGQWVIMDDVSPEYLGTFRALCYIRIISGTCDFAMDVEVGDSNVITRYLGVHNPYIQNSATAKEFVVDFGQINIQTSSVDELIKNTTITVRCTREDNGGSVEVHMAQIILIPTDESYIFVDPKDLTSASGGVSFFLEVDSYHPKRNNLASSRRRDSSDRVAAWLNESSVQRLKVSPNSDQRVYCFTLQRDFTDSLNPIRYHMSANAYNEVEVRYMKRYLSLRGDE